VCVFVFVFARVFEVVCIHIFEYTAPISFSEIYFSEILWIKNKEVLEIL